MILSDIAYMKYIVFQLQCFERYVETQDNQTNQCVSGLFSEARYGLMGLMIAIDPDCFGTDKEDKEEKK